jgi:hypothetical protein
MATMSDRILKVNAYTTLDLIEGRAEGHDFDEEALAVCNATSSRRNPDHVKLQVELDNTELDHLPAHAEELCLTPAEARYLAADLEENATSVEEARDDDGEN